MKRLPFIIAVLLLNYHLLFSQVAVNTTGAGPDPAAMLDVSSTSMGVLVPRLTTVQRTAIPNPPEGLLLYDTDTKSFWYVKNSTWTEITSGSSRWSLTGNSGTDPAVNFIGTTDNVPLKFRVNNQQAGWLDPTGNENTGFGYLSLFSNTTGFSNTAIGDSVLYYNSSGYANSATGDLSLLYNTTGSGNTAHGYASLYKNTMGTGNAAFGGWAAMYNTEGKRNTAIGATALCYNTTGNANVAVGTRALYNNTIRSNLVALGDSSLYNNGVGAVENWEAVMNTAVGSKSLFSNTTGSWNTASGYQALNSNTTGYDNTGYGYRTLYKNTTGIENTATGSIGLYHNTTGGQNTANGWGAMFSNTTGNNNSADGYMALYNNTAGHDNTAFGFQAGYHMTGGNGNIFIGSSSGPTSNQAIDSSMWLGNTSANQPLIYGDLIDGRIGLGTSAPNSSAKLDIVSTDKGLLIPRMTNAQIASFGSTLDAAHKGMMVFNTDDIKIEYWDGTAWKTMVTKTTTSGGSSDGTSFCSEGAKDYDGHQYKTVKIGDQCWMADNLKSTHYADGSAITGHWAYNDDEALAHTYGRLYNWEAVMHGAASSNSNPSGVQGICPAGWHVPSDAEWKELEMTLGMTTAEADGSDFRGTHCEGRKLKETDEAFLWTFPISTSGSNNSGFTAFPGGFRDYNGYYGLMNEALFWSSTESSSSNAWHRILTYYLGEVGRQSHDKILGFSARCLKD